MNPKYRFLLYLNDNEANKRPVNPTYKTDIAKEYELENNQKFYRTKLSGKVNFIGVDFTYIMAQPFDTEYKLLIERSDDWGQTWQYEYLGKFFRTDCKINEDDKKIEVQPDPVDEYTGVLAGLEKEYNLIPLAPEVERLILQKRPLIQIYIPGDNVVSCFLGGNYWEQDANATTNETDLVNKFYFALCNLLKEINVTVNGTPLAASGLYTGRLSIENDGGSQLFRGTLRANNSNYYLEITQVRFNAGGGIWTFGQFLCQLKRTSDNVVLFEYSDASIGGTNYDNLDFTMNPLNGATGTASAEMATYRIYARYLLDVDSIRGLNTYELPSDDIVAQNRNYRRAIGYAIDVAYISQNFSDTPTEWGRADNLKYYQPPYSIFGQVFYPIARSTWRYASIWFSFDIMDNFIEVEGRKRYLLRDTYPVYSVINTLLKQFAPNITHTPTPDCSLFFYGSQNPISFQKFTLFVTQKSNILNGNYTQPAQKAPATLAQFLNMLRDCFRCYWHIENGKLRIEHVSWYENGGSYSGGDVVGIDLTTMINIRNGKNWAFATSEITFDKVDMPERYQFDWMDDVTLAFKGLPIEVKSKYVTPGKIEDISIGNFTSDVDMMILNPSDMSKDGFALFAGVASNALVEPDEFPFGGSTATNGLTDKYEIKSETTGMLANFLFTVYSAAGASFEIVFFENDNIIYTMSGGGSWTVTGERTFDDISATIPLGGVGGFAGTATHVAFNITGTATVRFYSMEVPGLQELPFVQRQINGVDYFLQNGYLAFVLLQPNFYTYDLPAYNVLINGANAMVMGIQKKKKQEVNFPVLSNPNMLQLVKTNIGNGTIEKMSINLHSRAAKTTLKYDTE